MTKEQEIRRSTEEERKAVIANTNTHIILQSDNQKPRS